MTKRLNASFIVTTADRVERMNGQVLQRSNHKISSRRIKIRLQKYFPHGPALFGGIEMPPKLCRVQLDEQDNIHSRDTNSWCPPEDMASKPFDTNSLNRFPIHRSPLQRVDSFFHTIPRMDILQLLDDPRMGSWQGNTSCTTLRHLSKLDGVDVPSMARFRWNSPIKPSLFRIPSMISNVVNRMKDKLSMFGIVGPFPEGMPWSRYQSDPSTDDRPTFPTSSKDARTRGRTSPRHGLRDERQQEWV